MKEDAIKYVEKTWKTSKFISEENGTLYWSYRGGHITFHLSTGALYTHKYLSPPEVKIFGGVA